MKIILTHEVSGLGAAGDVVDVKDGYARNYLVPRGFAIRWTKGGEKDVAQIRRARKIHEIATIEQANEIKTKLEAVKVRLAVRSGDAGRLFGSVTPADIASAIKAAGGPDVDKRRVELGSPIKTLGGHQVSVRLHPEVAASLGIEVVAA
ncbi:50S ribosomal protein L9 [Streptomyces sp. NBC_00257]|jgi:large subunit ribosomal protein L9|uniref:50S ribosomal protein L9 n=1 Tax=Streptomyces TaxID=1883 RepID=UPI000F5BBDEE|nr:MULTISPECIES: 50S ribosomal protein L9 [Streptomyces]WSG52069.1 50S ribosomal protein L9 [Streptomyces sp. NBC_01732]WSW06670.1 50S ribosomal protein L9 [Streptomyces sp. NBC_01005]WSX02683.1 50S ribosomal protein L9 [Streptomyces sp. NBC_00987]WTB55476.1 50S ribosomal protein L9 [Streptomyces sp. NBC_00826]WTC96175.1 50S ribosomal protein L9 [Streptomyces sp. NBC_01650]WTH91642.1 50S ribosomal protein L9 [Streptomyces sp. NBC_00825]WTI00370.1 50S ribosomal protein L9 [Streptomyces sp. NB